MLRYFTSSYCLINILFLAYIIPEFSLNEWQAFFMGIL